MPMTKYLKAKTISNETRKKVITRQGCRSVSGLWLNKGNTEYHHFVERSSGGVGYEWNIVALTSEEHRCLHDGVYVGCMTNDQFKELIRFHLESHYEKWNEELCHYHKYWSEKDYGVLEK